jgi:hypothetical protein
VTEREVQRGAELFLMQKHTPFVLLLLFLLTGQGFADVFIRTTVNERLSYEISLPNGDVQKGVVRECGSGGWHFEDIRLSGKEPVVVQFATDAGAKAKVKVPADHELLVYVGANGKLNIDDIGFGVSGSQKAPNIFKVFNLTGQSITFDLVDQKEVRKGNALGQAEVKQFDGRNAFDGWRTELRIVGPDGNELLRDNGVRNGNVYLILKSSDGKIFLHQAANLVGPR